MGSSPRTWQLISLVLAVALLAALVELHQGRNARNPLMSTLPTVNSSTSLKHLALSPNARRVHERYSL